VAPEFPLPATPAAIPASLLQLVADAVRPLAVLSPTTALVARSGAWASAFDAKASGLLLGRGPALAGAVAEALRGSSISRPCIVLPDGRRVNWSVAPWRDADNTVRALLVFADPEHAGDELARRLTERDQLLTMLFEKSPLGLNLCRMDGLWIRSNDAFLDIIGYSHEEADGVLTYRELTPREYDVQEAKQLANLSAAGRYGPYEKEFIRKDGTRVPVRLSGFLVEHGGQEFIWSFIEDITERRALEAELQRETLKTLQAAKLATVGEMAAGIAHEVNNPLALIDAAALLAEDGLENGELDLVAEALPEIRRAVERAGRIVRGLRRFARESPHDPDATSPVSTLLDDALAMVEARMRNHGVRLVRDDGAAVSVRGDPLELSQVLVNLALNAFQAVSGGPGGTVWIRTDALVGGRVRIRVEDDGPGIPADARARLFEPFYTTKEVGDGTGLGLSISRGIVQSVGGRLYLDEDAPRTRFVVELEQGAP
jgi:PAS domain S-box-containing protein